MKRQKVNGISGVIVSTSYIIELMPDNEIIQEAADHYRDYVLLDHDGLMSLRSIDPEWKTVSASMFKLIYAFYCMGVHPAVAYTEMTSLTPQEHSNDIKI